ncbi:hypothetical protein ACIOEX_11220 [Streptomyces sp. NPDC087850]|uniref:hypothetical protein n=1 Tax=unclassified Streptomyces TaxID=2593676 RepID=UPI00382B2C5A
MKRIVSTALAAALVSGGTIALGVTPASAAAACDKSPNYSISKKSTVWRATNLHSDWVRPGIEIQYSKSATGTWSATGSATVGAEAGVIFAKAEVSFGVELTRSWEKSGSWSYTATPKKKAGKTMGRLMMHHSAKSFTVTKWNMVSSGANKCKKRVLYTKTGVVPVKRNENLWGIQYR